ncbi:MAG: hypothetical protein LC790_20120 [Actinobacteria bacterium]|nr:hypothetical protein [Actinomycetota bacterium]
MRRQRAGRAWGANQGTELGSFLEQLTEDLDYDRNTLKDLMGRLDIRTDQLKLAASWLFEKAGRLKLNGSLTEYSPLSRLVELEALTTGVSGKLSLWQMLSQVQDEPILVELDHHRFIERAQAQLSGLEQQRRAAAQIAFAEGD